MQAIAIKEDQQITFTAKELSEWVNMLSQHPYGIVSPIINEINAKIVQTAAEAEKEEQKE